MDDLTKIEKGFDELLNLIQRRNLSSDKDGSRVSIESFEQVKEWKNKYGYKFNVYSNEHLIDGKQHFHFDNKAEDISCKMDFDGNILEVKGSKSVPPNILKDLQYFVAKESIRNLLEKKWNEMNPHLIKK